MSAPVRKLDVRVNDEARTLKMTYGMLTELLRVAGASDPTMVNVLITDLTARDHVIRRLFTDKQVAITAEEDLISAFELDIDADEVDRIITWVMEHFADFFLRQLAVAKAVHGQMEPAAAPATTAS